MNSLCSAVSGTFIQNIRALCSRPGGKAGNSIIPSVSNPFNSFHYRFQIRWRWNRIVSTPSSRAHRCADCNSMIVYLLSTSCQVSTLSSVIRKRHIMHHAFIPDNLRALNHREVINEKSVALPRGRDILLLETDAPQLSHCAYLDDVYVPCARDLVSRSGCMRYRRSRLDRDARAISYPCTDRVPLRLEIVIVLAASV